MEFWEYMDKVGMMHVGQGRKHPLHIEYIHMGALLGFVQDIMTEAILSNTQLDMKQKVAIVKALGKIMWIQNGGPFNLFFPFSSISLVGKNIKQNIQYLVSYNLINDI